jgi:hypothetical protein
MTARDITFILTGYATIAVPWVDKTNEEIEAILEEHGRIRFTGPNGQITTIYKEWLAGYISVPSKDPES